MMPNGHGEGLTTPEDEKRIEARLPDSYRKTNPNAR